MAKSNFQDLRVYQLSENLSDEIWKIVLSWDNFARDTIGANIAEGEGRGSFQDNRRFVKIARGSLQETQHWLRRAFKRHLLTKEQTEKLSPLVERLAPTLNAYLRSIGTTRNEGQRTKDKGQ